MTAPVRLSRPPLPVVRSLNVVLRQLLRTPLGRWVRPLALLDFRGRRTGRRYRIPVGWYDTAEGPVAFTPAGWRSTFRDGADAVVHHRGRSRRMVGTLVSDPTATARALDEVLCSSQSKRFLALKVEPGHRITAEEVAATGSTMVRFHPVD